MYGYLKIDVLINKKDVNLLSSTNQFHYSDRDIFSFKDGLNIAVALTAYDEELEWILDSKYGQLVFQEYGWGTKDDGSYEVLGARLASAVCTPEQLGLAEGGKEDAEFLPLHENYYNVVAKYRKKFLCSRKEDMFIYGDYNSERARLIEIKLIRC